MARTLRGRRSPSEERSRLVLSIFDPLGLGEDLGFVQGSGLLDGEVLVADAAEPHGSVCEASRQVSECALTCLIFG